MCKFFAFKILRKIRMVKPFELKESSTYVVYIDLETNERRKYVQDDNDSIIILD